MVVVWTTQLDRLRADLTLYASPDVRRLDEKINAGLEKMTEESNRAAACSTYPATQPSWLIVGALPSTLCQPLKSWPRRWPGTPT